MKIVLLSGGSGQRLWPLSNDTRSKQFLKLLKNDKGEPESMVQRVYRQLRQSGIKSEIVIATGKGQESSIRSHLGNLVDIILEPERRDTFPAIALATAYLFYKKNTLLDETIAIMPVDPFAEGTFFEKISLLDKKVKEKNANLGLLGIRPTYASAKYGYILSKKEKVTGFVEKPSEKKAAEIIKTGALWNGGVFIFKIRYMLEIISNYIEFNSFEDVLSQYTILPKKSFDYEVSEKESNIVMVEYDGFWKDLGTWNTLTEVMEENNIGKVITSEDSENTHVINELDNPITVIGAKNMIIVASPDGILVSDKLKSSKLKEYIGGLSAPPKYEEKTWGSVKILEQLQEEDGSVSMTSSIYLENRKTMEYNGNSLNETFLTITSGNGCLISRDEKRNIKKGDIIYIKEDESYTIVAQTNIRLIEVTVSNKISCEDVTNCIHDKYIE